MQGLFKLITLIAALAIAAPAPSRVLLAVPEGVDGGVGDAEYKRDRVLLAAPEGVDDGSPKSKDYNRNVGAYKTESGVNWDQPM
ncbi:hypothetical protein F4804DRAFT_339201 [Jackrogersella minutella]|nr:hypothetical protein F4804DRAFT_339201 [Jackrogersella minutella]